ncbi:glycosyltransferase [Nocardioides bruguierae]|uniref:glycosyltransferase n=1 Tax=Nocardioides bruguierae TaxID=2945102 RepID=UPI002020ADCE|nr:glycosyltransferase [Nocardioides bruguierae]MCL8025061.1 glycosyltransferase [Nocardioides bruguierae]
MPEHPASPRTTGTGTAGTTPDVAIVSLYPRLGSRHDGDSGVASYTANLAHALADAGLAVCVVAPVLEGEPAVGHDGPVEVRRAFTSGRPAAVRDALAAARATGAAQVHLQFELFLYHGASGLPVTVAALAHHRRAGAPLTLTMHQVVDPAKVTAEYTRMHRIGVPPVAARAAIAGVQRALPRLASTTIVHEPAFERLVPGAVVVPHGIEVPEPGSREGARERLGVTGDALVAMSFGFVAPYKGLETVLTAATMTQEDVQVVVAGGTHPRLAAQGDDYEERLIATYGHRARFTGFVPDTDVADWFRAADVLCLNYPEPHASSGPLALALAHRTPMVLSPRLAEVIGVPALSVGGRGEAADWAARLDALAADGGALAALRGRTDALAADRTWPAVARRHAALYEAVDDAALPAPTATHSQEVTDERSTDPADHAVA